jgi:hypothetical protein
MHKDRPPGIFDLTGRSLRYIAVLGLIVGFLAGVLTAAAYTVVTSDTGRRQVPLPAVNSPSQP